MKRWNELADAYRNGTIDRAELRELLDTLGSEGHEDLWTEAMRSEWEGAADAGLTDSLRGERLLRNILEASSGHPNTPVAARPQWLRRLAVAAAVAGVVAAGWWMWTATRVQVPRGGSSPAAYRQVPRLEASERITLVRADGSRILLDDTKDGALEVETAVEAVKGGDGITYSAREAGGGRLVYNTIATPRGGRFRVTLSDGSRVWLNAASSLRFPVAFPGDAREVEVTGQAYFEVARHPGRPFRVKVGDATVEVLGTHFDVMAYPDEAEMRTTLMEGAVRFRSPVGEALLAPGQQSSFSGSGRLRVHDGVDTDRVRSWKDGVLAFSGDDIGNVCRTLSRAYDVTLSYDPSIRERFHAAFPLETGLDTVLKALEMTGRVRFERKGDQVRAMPVGDGRQTHEHEKSNNMKYRAP